MEYQEPDALYACYFQAAACSARPCRINVGGDVVCCRAVMWFRCEIRCCFYSCKDERLTLTQALRKNTFNTLKYHLIGITKLFRHRGPLGYGNSFELDLLHANVPFIVSQTHNRKGRETDQLYPDASLCMAK